MVWVTRRSVSRLYEYNACIDQRNNNFTMHPFCGTLTTNHANNSAEYAGEATCRKVFASGAQAATPLHCFGAGCSPRNSCDKCAAFQSTAATVLPRCSWHSKRAPLCKDALLVMPIRVRACAATAQGRVRHSLPESTSRLDGRLTAARCATPRGSPPCRQCCPLPYHQDVARDMGNVCADTGCISQHTRLLLRPVELQRVHRKHAEAPERVLQLHRRICERQLSAANRCTPQRLLPHCTRQRLHARTPQRDRTTIRRFLGDIAVPREQPPQRRRPPAPCAAIRAGPPPALHWRDSYRHVIPLGVLRTRLQGR
jgi:hypothetical protein